MRIVFMGSPDFAVPSLKAVAQRHDVALVVTQPDRPKGRGRQLTPPPVKLAAQELGLELFQPEKLRRRSVREQLGSYQAELFVVVAYGQILSPRLLATPAKGCINVHASLLPAYRGAAPIQWSVLNGDSHSGVTIMQMEAGLDSGPMLLDERIEIRADDTAGTLHDRLSDLGANLLVRALDQIAAGEISPRVQDHDAATYAPMLKKADGLVDFNWPAHKVDRWIRGMDPWPCAFTSLGKERLVLFNSSVSTASGDAGQAPGQVLTIDDRGMLVACGEAAVWIAEVQLAGKRRVRSHELAAGRKLSAGMRLGNSPETIG